MPRRPPKKWFYESLRNVKKYHKDVDDPAAFVSWVWYHVLKYKTKNDILTDEGIARMKKQYRKKKRLHGKIKRHSRRRVLKHKTVKRRTVKIRRKKSSMKGGAFMSKKRRHHKRRYHGFEGAGRRSIVVAGMDGARRRHGRRRGRHVLLGDPGIKDIGMNTINVAAGVAGGVGGAYLVNMIPNVDAKIKAGINVIAGVLLASMLKTPALKFAGVGLGIMGGAGLLKQFGIPLPIAGDPALMIVPPAQQALIQSRVLGDPATMDGAWASQANM